MKKPIRLLDEDFDNIIDRFRQQLYEDTKNMTPEERGRYIYKNGEKFRRALKNTDPDAYDWSFLD
jgi:hypothetical protein